MASMEDLIATVSGTMHVSQHGHDIKALQDYLSQTMSMPQIPQSGYLAPSRSTSVSRKPQPVTTPLYESSQPFPSPAATAYGFNEHVRPASLQRQSSYGFGRSGAYDDTMGMETSTAGAGPSSPAVGSYDAFAADAFAPLNHHNQAGQDSDPWARMRQAQAQAQPTSAFGQQFLQQSQQPQQHNPWAGFGQSTSGFGGFQQQTQHQRYGGGRLPTPPDEDDEMGMDEDDDGEVSDVDSDEDDFDVDGRAGQRYDGGQGMSQDKRAFSMSGLDEQQQVASAWQRGRRKT